MTYTPLYQPFAHQVEANEKMWGKQAFALLMGMRTGKTKVCLDDYGRMELEGKARNLCVLAPAGVYDTWETACSEHLSLDLQRRYRIARWKSGGNKSWGASWERFLSDTDKPRVMIMNIEALSTVQRAKQDLLMFLSQGPNVCAIDESTCIMGYNSKRTDFVCSEVSHLATYRRILSGLPTPKSPLDLYSQFEFLNWRILGHRSFFTYRARYAKLKNIRVPVPGQFDSEGKQKERDVKIVVDFQNVEELYGKIAPFSYRKRLQDCYNMPEKVYQIRKVQHTPEQKRIYKEMKQYSTAELGDGTNVTASIVIAKMLKLHQINCGHVKDEWGGFKTFAENRTTELGELLKEYDGKAIIWCAYDYDVKNVSEYIRKQYGPQSVAQFWGGNKAVREGEEVRFKTDPNCTFMVATAGAGGRGRDWSVANLVVYYSYTDNLEHNSQSEERTQKIGKTSHVLNVYLVTPGTVDEAFAHSMREKIDLARMIMNDGEQKWLI